MQCLYGKIYRWQKKATAIERSGSGGFGVGEVESEALSITPECAWVRMGK